MTRRRKSRERHERMCKRFMTIVGILMAVCMVIGIQRGTQSTIRKADELSERVEKTIAESQKSIEETQRMLDVAAEWKDRQQETEKMTEKMTEKEKSTAERMEKYDTVSSDWGNEIDDFVYYKIPVDYTATGGYMPEKVQIYTYCICKAEGVSYPLILAMIEHESGYVFDKIGDEGNSKGYMQIYESAHRDRMEKLGCNDLINPYQNIRVGVDFMKELIEKYGNEQDALAAYNYGETGARKYLWNNGIYVYEYNEEILKRKGAIKEGLKE